MRNLQWMLAVAIVVLFASACNGAGPNAPSTLTSATAGMPTPAPTKEVVPTITPTETPLPTLTLTPTSTPAPTLTPTITFTRVPTIDANAPSRPEKPFASRWAKPYFDNERFSVFQQTIHARPVTIAWEISAQIPTMQQSLVSYYYFEMFKEYWEIFRGFPYDSYTVVFKNIDKSTQFEETGIGYEAPASLFVGDISGIQGMISHQVFHAWVGNALCDLQEKKLHDGLWFEEGITQYYGDRGGAYLELMRDHWYTYRKNIGTNYDIPLTDMPAKALAVAGESTFLSSPYRNNVYWKGALVAFMMGQQLAKKGLNLDHFLRALYEKYALRQQCFTTTQAMQELNLLTGEDWSDFFAKYIYGTTRLPLNENAFDFLVH